MSGYVIPTCECGHAEGDHRSSGAGFPHPVSYGGCRYCKCRRFKEIKPARDAAWLLEAGKRIAEHEAEAWRQMR